MPESDANDAIGDAHTRFLAAATFSAFSLSSSAIFVVYYFLRICGVELVELCSHAVELGDAKLSPQNRASLDMVIAQAISQILP